MSEEVKNEEGNQEEVKPEEVKTEEVAAGTAETAETKTEEAKAEPVAAEAVKAAEVKTEEVKTEEVKKKTSHTGMRKTRIGKVLSNKMDKTIIVSEEKKVIHPIYKKYYKKTTKFAAHDPNNTCDIGDKVKIMETRPLSKTKRWRLVEIVEKVK
ncbi:MAG: 30S ribosomal protein S17 [Ignavibacteriae bacterium]|nr:30S ribosomal protein S17 [Ignavibacteriota bacterium]